jgi:hypothetical protein
MSKGRPSFFKREREKAKRERQLKKAERRAEAAATKASNPKGEDGGVDPDIAHIQLGPQPPQE